ncbi:MAG TPA: DUF4244 domain-containing protein [Actinophytocola sp.]|nr:DUF4244 domain-containing protein [Actinophytocola sp.]
MFPHPSHLRPRREFLLADDGLSTVEYAIGLIAAAALAMVLYAIVTGQDVAEAITAIIQRALTVA